MNYLLNNDTWGQEEKNIAKEVIDSGYYTMGKRVSEYEKVFASKFGAKYAVMSNSGSSANLLVIAALVYSGRIKKDDEVIVTAVSWSTTYFPLMQYGLKLRFVDIDPGTLNASVDEIRKAITPDTKMVMAVNLLGNPNDFDKLQTICESYNLILIEDNCESMGATYRNTSAGTFGDAGTFSTFYSHHICTMEGGMSITDDEELYHYMLSIRAHGWTRQLPYDSAIYSKGEDEFYENFNFIMPGYNLRPLEIEAAIGLEQLKKLDQFIEMRRENASYLRRKIQGETSLIMQKECGKSSWYGFALILPKEKEGMRNTYIKALSENEVETRPVMAGNFTRQKGLSYAQYSILGDLPNADYLHYNGFYVGNHSVLIKDKIDYLVDILKNI